MDESTTQRFWKLVDTSGDCWIWTGGVNNGGRPVFNVTYTPRLRVSPARWLYEQEHGPLVPKQIMVATCKTRNCIRHVRVGTGSDRAIYSEEATAERFWAKVPVGAEGCWEWQGVCDGPGRYGRSHYKNKPIGAHRLAWILTHGPIPPGSEICHRCDNPPCVRPDHLFLGSRAVNAADMVAKGRAARNRPHAKLTPEQVRELRARHAAGGISYSQLAALYGLTKMAAYNIVQGKSYPHVAWP